jgi:hypothetical protein
MFQDLLHTNGSNNYKKLIFIGGNFMSDTSFDVLPVATQCAITSSLSSDENAIKNVFLETFSELNFLVA